MDEITAVAEKVPTFFKNPRRLAPDIIKVYINLNKKMENFFSREEIEPMLQRAMFEGQLKSVRIIADYLQSLLEPDLAQLKYLKESGMTLGEDFMRLYTRTSTLLEIKQSLEKLLNDLKVNNT
jgi:hypothetical protein